MNSNSDMLKINSNITTIMLFVFLTVFGLKCTPELDDEMPTIERKVVVDGWIEDNGYANVILTYNSPYFGQLDSSSFRNLVATRAKVSISDSHGFEILTLIKDTNYFPPYIYRGNSLKGKTGSTYRLLIEDEIDTIFATTTIPAPAFIDSIWFEKNQNNDSLGLIKGIFTDDLKSKNYYKTFYRIKNRNKKFIPTLISDYDDFYFNGQKFTFSLRKGPETFLKPYNDIYFRKNDTIVIKISSIDKASYDFWLTYQNEVINSGNPFAANHNNIKSNIVGGLGIWCGYGSRYYSVIAK